MCIVYVLIVHRYCEHYKSGVERISFCPRVADILKELEDMLSDQHYAQERHNVGRSFLTLFGLWILYL